MNFSLPDWLTEISKLLKEGTQIPLAIKNYPSRGQTSIQELYQTKIGKIFLKRTSERNHKDTQVKKESGSLAEREYWSFCLARYIGLNVPVLKLLDIDTTVQTWLDYPDAHTFLSRQGRLTLKSENVFDCGLFDWITGQIDRHDANFLYNYNQDEIILVDSAHAFLKYEGGLPDYLSYFEISNPKDLELQIPSKVQKNILALSQNQLKKLIPLRNKEEWHALWERKEKLASIRSVQDILNLYRGKP